MENEWLDREEKDKTRGKDQREGKVIFMYQEILQPRQKAFFLERGDGGHE